MSRARLPDGMTETGQTPTDRLPRRIARATLVVPDTQLLTNGALVLRCGRLRDAIRAPYELGVIAYAIARKNGVEVGDVLAHRRQYVYFLVPPGTGPHWDALLASVQPAAGIPTSPLRLLGPGAIIVLPSDRRSRAVRWLHGPGLGPAASAADVLTVLRQADERQYVRSLQRVRDQENAELIRRVMEVFDLPSPALPEESP
jgi:hypothetical protein